MALRLSRNIGFVLAWSVLLAGNFDKTARAAAPAVSIGDVSIAPEAADGEPTAELGRTLRRALTDELGQLKGVDFVRRPLVLSATLARLSSERHDENGKATAVISLSVRHLDDHALCAEVRGRATVEQTDESLGSLRRAALTGAVRGAVARLGEVVRRAP